MANSTRKRPKKKSEAQKIRDRLKVGKDFRLTPREDGRWAKRIGNRTHYFGRWKDPTSPGHPPKVSPDEAKAMYEYFLVHGELPSDGPDEPDSDVVTVGYLFDSCLAFIEKRVESGERSRRTYLDYLSTWNQAAKILGKSKPVNQLKPSDFANLRDQIAKTRSMSGVASFVRKMKVPFRWGAKEQLIDPVGFGSGFDPPTSASIRAEQEQNGEKYFEPEEVLALLKVASVPMKAMSLLAINVAFGNNDVASVRIKDFDLASGVPTVSFSRPKTKIYRRAVLWPETVQALREWLAIRPKALDPADDDLMFLTAYGRRWTTDSDNAVSKEFRKLVDELDLNNKHAHEEDESVQVRRNRGFYSLRHSFRTAADDVPDEGAIAVVMGHVLPGMSAVYVKRKRISNDRLKAVSDRVHTWLYGEGVRDDKD